MTAGPWVMSEWNGRFGVQHTNFEFDAHPYRRVGNHEVHHAVVFAMQALGLVASWAHPPFFNYHYRHIALKRGEIDPWISQGGAVGSPFYLQVPGVAAVNSSFDGDFGYEMLQKHFPISSVAPWVVA